MQEASWPSSTTNSPTLLGELHTEPDTEASNRRDLCGSPSKVGFGGDKSRKPTRLWTRLIDMTLTDDRTRYEIDEHANGYAGPRRPALRTVLVALAAVGLLIVLVALVVGGGGGGSSAQRGSLSTASPAVNGPADVAGQTAGGGESSAGGGSAGAPSFGTAGSLADAKTAPSVAVAPTAPKAPGVPVDTVTKVIKTGDIDLQVGKHQV